VIQARVNAFAEGFSRITADVEERITQGLDDGAAKAAEVAQENASIDLQIRVIPPGAAADARGAGIASGIRADKTTRNSKKTTPIARFFDQGTLGKRRGPLKQSRKDSWTVDRGGSTYTAHRRDIDGKGVEPEGFFRKAQTAGRQKLIRVIHDGL
jgi:hypothetical protein